MWEAIAEILTNSNAFLILVFAVVFTLIFVLMARTGLLQIHTNSFRMGADHRERDIIRQQTEWTHSYIMSLAGEIVPDNSKYGGYFAKYVLEAVYDEVINWITFNHINLESDYVSIKQAKIKAIVRSMPVDQQYRTKDFDRRIDKWVEEVIHKLIVIREVYK